MNSRVDESDADTPQEAPATTPGAPTDEDEAVPADPLAELFGTLPRQKSPADAAAAALSRERLAALFARVEDPPAAHTAGSVEQPPDDPATPVADASLPVAATAAERAAFGAIDLTAADASDASTVDSFEQDGTEAAEFADWIATLHGEAPAEAPAEAAPEAAAAPEEPAEAAPSEAASLGALDELFARESAAAQSEDAGPVRETAPARDDALSGGAGAAALSTSNASAASGTFAPHKTRIGVRGALFGSRARTATSVTASVVLVAGLVAGAAFGAQTLAANARLAEARSALTSAEEAIAAPTDELASAYDAYDATTVTAQTMTGSVTPALAAVAGMTDQTALDAANAASAALVAALAGEKPPPPPADYVRGAVDLSEFEDVETAEQLALHHATEVAAVTTTVESADSALQTAVTALSDALDALAASLPQTAAAIAGENALAEQSFRDGVVATADALGAARAAGGIGDAELLAYAAAVTALRADQARAVDEAESRTVTRPRSGTTTPTPSPTPTPEPTPTVEPQPDPTPTPAPTP